MRGVSVRICRKSEIAPANRPRLPCRKYRLGTSTAFVAASMARRAPMPSSRRCEPTMLTAVLPSSKRWTAMRQAGPETGSMGRRACRFAQVRRCERGIASALVSMGSGGLEGFTQRGRARGRREGSISRLKDSAARRSYVCARAAWSTSRSKSHRHCINWLRPVVLNSS